MRGLALVAIAASVGVARADEPAADDVVATARLFAMAMQSHEPAALLAMMDAAVTFHLDDTGCGAAYDRPGKAARAPARKKLARCLSDLGWSRGGLAFVADGTRATARAFDRELVLDLRADGDELRVAAVTVRLVDATSTEQAFDDWVRANHPISADFALVTNLVGGDRDFPVTDAEQADIAAHYWDQGSREHLIVLKICADATGSLGVVRMVQASGYPDWNARVLRGVRATWDFAPIVTRTGPVAVCGFASFYPDLGAHQPPPPPP